MSIFISIRPRTFVRIVVFDSLIAVVKMCANLHYPVLIIDVDFIPTDW